MVYNFGTRFARAFGSHFSNRMRGKTTWDSAQIILAQALVNKLGSECVPFDTVFPNKETRRSIYLGIMNDDIDAVKECLDSCELMSYKPECCEAYRDAFRSLSESHPPQIKEALSSILKDAAYDDTYGLNRYQ